MSMKLGLLQVSLVALLSLLGGCGLLEQKPTARIVGMSLQDVNLQDATVAFDVEVSNPYAVPLPMVNVDYALARQGGASFLTGEAPLQGTVPAGGSRRVTIPARVVYSQLLNVLQNVRPGQVLPYAAEMGLSLDAPAVGALRVPLRKEGNLPIPTAPGVEVTQVRWDRLDLSGATGMVELALTNRNEFPIDLAEMNIDLSLGGVQVAQAAVDKAVSFAASGGRGTVQIPISISAAKMGMGLLRTLTGQSAAYSLTGGMKVDTPYAPMTIPLSASGNTLFRR